MEEVEQSETDSTEPEQQAEEPKFKIKVSGEEKELPISELIKLLKWVKITRKKPSSQSRAKRT